MRLALIAAVLGIPAIGLADPKPKPTPAPAVSEHANLEVQPSGKNPIKELTIDNPLGSVRVEGYDGTALQIESTKEAPTLAALHRLRISLVPTDGAVRITTTADGGREVTPVSRRAVRIDLVVHAPRNAHVDVTTSAGTLSMINMNAGGDLDSASGSIAVDNVSGEVSTHSVIGDTKLEHVFGSVDAQSLGADVDLTTIHGERLIASSAGKGKIAGHDVNAHEVELTTTEGRIVLEGQAALRSHLVVSSISGDLDVRLHRRGALIVRARTAGKLELGPTASIQPQADGWSQAQFGNDDTPAFVLLRSHVGVIRFAVVE